MHVELTDSGRAKHDELRTIVAAFDRQLRSALNDSELDTLRTLLDRLDASVGRRSDAPG